MSVQIKHLVLSGGAMNGLEQIGILNALCDLSFLDTSLIQSIHCTSIGSWLASLVALQIDWETIKYYVRRPFSKLKSLHITSEKILNIYNNSGMIESTIIEEFLGYIWEYTGVSKLITLSEFYEKTKVDIYIYATRLRGFEVHTFHHKTHPNMKLYEAIFMSSTLLPIMKPLYYENEYYIDGGYLNNYPLQQCLSFGHSKDEILGIRTKTPKKNCSIQEIHQNMSDLLLQFINESTLVLRKQYKTTETIPYELIISSELKDKMSLELIDDPDKRSEKITRGERIATEFLQQILHISNNHICDIDLSMNIDLDK